jgi:hypothetical protein
MHSVVARIMRAWAITGSVLLVTACTTTRVDYALPEASLLRDCRVTNVHPIDTNAQLAAAYLKRDNDLAVCNADKRALRVWAETMRDNAD